MMIGRVALKLAALVLAATAAWMPVAQSEESNEATLMHRLEDVLQQLHKLQLKVQRMKAELSAVQAPSSAPAPGIAAPPAASPPPPAPVRVEAGSSPSSAVIPHALQWREALREQWRSVKAGMSREEIRERLGTPSREYTLDGKPVWYYTYPGIGNGSVLFSRSGHTVAGWQYPPYGFW
jgi:hypothetical protein